MSSRLAELFENARNKLSEACERGSLRMSIPAQIDEDDDIVISNTLMACEAMLAVMEAADTLISDMGVEEDDKRIPYLVCQVYRGDLRRLREAIAKIKK